MAEFAAGGDPYMTIAQMTVDLAYPGEMDLWAIVKASVEGKEDGRVKPYRTLAKNWFLAILYGAGPPRLGQTAREFGLATLADSAQDAYDWFKATYPGARRVP